MSLRKKFLIGKMNEKNDLIKNLNLQMKNKERMITDLNEMRQEGEDKNLDLEMSSICTFIISNKSLTNKCWSN